MNPKTQSSRTGKTSLPIPDADTLRRILWAMKLTREAERRIEQVLYRQGKIVGGVYVGRGRRKRVTRNSPFRFRGFFCRVADPFRRKG